MGVAQQQVRPARQISGHWIGIVAQIGDQLASLLQHVRPPVFGVGPFEFRVALAGVIRQGGWGHGRDRG